MSKKAVVMVGFKKAGKAWQVTVQTGDLQLRQEIVDSIREAGKRGLTILNSADPLAGLEAKARKAKAKKAIVPGVGPYEGSKANV